MTEHDLSATLCLAWNGRKDKEGGLASLVALLLPHNKEIFPESQIPLPLRGWKG